jgi:hypothetical protein
LISASHIIQLRYAYSQAIGLGRVIGEVMAREAYVCEVIGIDNLEGIGEKRVRTADGW